MRLALAALTALTLFVADPAIRMESATANDPFFPQQWALTSINATAAWDVTTGSADVIVAIIDSGVDVTHPDLASKIVPGINAVTGTTDVDDPVGHGTHVAGIVAAATNNGIGIAGVAPAARIMPIKVLAADGTIDGKDVATGMKWAVDHGAKILNSSHGSPEEDLDVKAAVEYAYTKGALIVVAAGNCGVDPAECGGLVNPVVYPAVYDHVLSVASVSRSREHSSFSESGPYIKISAPGGELPKGSETPENTGVLSTLPIKIAPSGYGYLIGTSQAAPHVAGVAALVWAANPALTNKQVEDILTQTAADLGAPGRDPLFGWGEVDAAAAVKAAKPSLAGPALVSPADGAALTGLGTAVSWQNPSGTTQYQLQVIPTNNDGPGVNLIISDAAQVAKASFQVEAPVFGRGPYVMLPGMSYTWRVRTSNSSTGLDQNSSAWGAWSPTRSFRTPPPSSATLTPAAPADGASSGGGPVTLRWADSNTNLFYYEIQVSPDAGFNTDPATATTFVWWNLVHGGVANPPDSWTAPAGLPSGATVYWRVRPRVQGDGTPVAWGPTWSFKTTQQLPK